MRLLKSTLSAGAAAVVLAAAGVASAHMPYLLPGVFTLGGRANHVTLQSAFTEDPFIAEVVLKSDFFFAKDPAGAETPIATPTYLRDLAVLEAATPAEGTYRFSTGPRQGRKGKMYKDAKGEWLMVGEEAEGAPAGAQLVDVASITTAEAYVTKGKPSAAALEAKGVGLELKPISHPSDIGAGQAAKFQLLFDGKPLAGALIRLYRAAGVFDGKKVAGEAKTAADGTFSLTAPDAGLYMTIVRHRTASPAGAETPYRSYTHTLSFEAAQ
jgi:hypothetical protein